jgi:phosphoribosylamine--glycine ligase
VIEEGLTGPELSLLVLCDGTLTGVPLAPAQDFKRFGDGDLGPNTGGIGAYSPVPVATDALVQRIMERAVTPTLARLASLDIEYRGVLYAGLMLTAEGPKLIEYNVRFGDPETQVLMMRLEGDLLELLFASAPGRLAEVAPPGWRDEAALTVVMAANGYPGQTEKGSIIRGIDRADAMPAVKVFHAGTALRDGEIVANGGRVLNVTARGATLGEAQARAYATVDVIDWPEGFSRRDIGWRAV